MPASTFRSENKPLSSGQISRSQANVAAQKLAKANVGNLKGLSKSIVTTSHSIKPKSANSNLHGATTSTSLPKRVSLVAQAHHDMQFIKLGQIKLYSNGKPTVQSVAEFIKELPKSEQQSLLTKEGRPNRGAQKRMQAAMLLKGYDDEFLVELLYKATSEESSHLIAALSEEAPYMASLKNCGEYDLRCVLTQAVREVVITKLSSNCPVMSQSSPLFAEGSAPLQMVGALTQLIEDNLSSRDHLSRIFHSIGNELCSSALQLGAFITVYHEVPDGADCRVPQQVLLDTIEDLVFNFAFERSHGERENSDQFLAFLDEFEREYSRRAFIDGMAGCDDLKGTDVCSSDKVFADGVLDAFRAVAFENGTGFVMDDNEWITVHPNGKGLNSNGEEIKGRHVLVEKGSRKIVAGLGGKFNGKRLDEISHSPQQASSKSHKQQAVKGKSASKGVAQSKSAAAKHVASKGNNSTQQAAPKITASKSGKLSKQAAKVSSTAKVGVQGEKAGSKLSASIRSGASQQARSGGFNAEARKPQKAAAAAFLGYTGSVSDGFEVPKEGAFNIMCEQVADDSKLQRLSKGFQALSDPTWTDPQGLQFDSAEQQLLYDQVHREVLRYDTMRFIGACPRTIGKYVPQSPTKEMVERGDKAYQAHAKLQSEYAAQKLPQAEQELAVQIQEVSGPIKQALKSDEGFKDAASKAAVSLANGLVQEINALSGGKASTNDLVRELFAQFQLASFDLSKSSLPNPIGTPAVAHYIRANLLYQQCQLAYQHASDKDKQLLGSCLAKAKTSVQQANELLKLSENVTSFGHAIERIAGKLYQAKYQSGGHNYAPSSVAGVAKDRPMSFAEANELRGNPYFKFSDLYVKDANGNKYYPYRNNCQTCVVANEMRRRGYDVEAQPNKLDDSNLCTELSYFCHGIWRNPVTCAPPDVIKVASFADLNEQVQEGQRFSLQWSWKRSNPQEALMGHIVSVLREEGKCFIYDPQSGKKYALAKFGHVFGHMVNMSTICAFRVDNCEVLGGYANKVLVQAHLAPPVPSQHKEI